MDTLFDVRLLLLVWLLVASGVILVRWKRRSAGVGLVFTYVILLSFSHWLATILYLLPWYWPIFESSLVEMGLQQSVIGLLGFAAGSVLLWPLLKSFGLLSRKGDQSASVLAGRSDPRLPRIYVLIGFASYFAIAPLSARIPTLSAIVGGLTNLLLVGMALACWQAWQRGRPQAMVAWLLVAAIWPFITVGSQGFLGAGLSLLVTLLAFVFQFIGFRKRLFVVAFTLFYIGLSVYVTYMQSRDQIRSVVWSDDASVEQRVDVVFASVREIAWFDPFSQDHLYWIDIRMNQNYLVGAAAHRLAHGYNDYAMGETLADVVVMLVPRAVWPDKPLRVGGSARVTEYTGIPFYGSTSVGTGQVMEFYINFGSIGVLLGFVLMGCLLAMMDETAAWHLWRGDWPRFAMWYLPVLSLLRPDNDLFVLIASSVSGVVAIVAVNLVVAPLLRRRPVGHMHPGAGLSAIDEDVSQRVSTFQ